jgi:hypothetical protein
MKVWCLQAVFPKNGTDSIEKICNGNDYIRFTDISIPMKLLPGDGFDIVLNYESTMDYLM